MIRVRTRTTMAGGVTALLCIVAMSPCAAQPATASAAATVEPTAPASPGQTGIASWYGGRFHGRRTASGEIYDMHEMTAAHRTLPLGSVVEITNLDNGRSTVARINDRGPFIRNRIVDCSHAVAKSLGFTADGLAPVRVRVLASTRPRRANEDTAPVAMTESATDHKYCVQLGAFRDPSNAEVLVRRASSLPLPVFVHAARALQQVLVGPFTDPDAAAAARRDLRLAGLAGFVRTYEAPSAPLAATTGGSGVASFSSAAP